jgi:RNA-directed DNA polymerase
MRVERRGWVIQSHDWANLKGEEPMTEAKPFGISKRAVWEAYQRVKENRGAAGVDGQSLEDFERDLANNLYKLWNRLASGSYFPPPVLAVEIPKAGGGSRRLGVPTVSDRIAQMVVKQAFEPEVEPYFHPDSYGYRPGKSALQAVGVTRQRCWQYDYVLEFDIKGLFDAIDHRLLRRAVAKHTDCRWVRLYIERWLVAPFAQADGTQVARTRGTPQGGVVSPLLANLYLHYVFDKWMERHCPAQPFARYADDGVVHCRSEAQARWLKARLDERFRDCGLELHPEKTRVVCCNVTKPLGEGVHKTFDFLGYGFRPRLVRCRDGRMRVNFTPAISQAAAKRVRAEVRRWRLHRRPFASVQDLAQAVNPVIRGWIQYYGAYNRSALVPLLRHIDWHLLKWVKTKYRKRRGSWRRARYWLGQVARHQSALFAHWRVVRPCVAE